MATRRYGVRLRATVVSQARVLSCAIAVHSFSYMCYMWPLIVSHSMVLAGVHVCRELVYSQSHVVSTCKLASPPSKTKARSLASFANI